MRDAIDRSYTVPMLALPGITVLLALTFLQARLVISKAYDILFLSELLLLVASSLYRVLEDAVGRLNCRARALIRYST